MNASELRNKSASELKDEMFELLKEQFNLRMQKGAGQLGNSSRFKSVRKDIARIKTVLNEMGSAQ